MPYISADLKYHTTTMQGRPEVKVETATELFVWLTEEDLIELLAALRRRKVKK